MAAKPNIGVGVDSVGNAVVDPTANVLSLVEAAVSRLDDLREANDGRIRDLRVSDTHWFRTTIDQASVRLNDILSLHVSYQKELALAEAKRIDAIRAVDVAAVATASERAAQQANVLATQVATSAETLRALVASTAAQVAAQLQQVSGQITERLSLVEKSQYEVKGKSSIADPQVVEMMASMQAMVKAQAGAAGKSDGSSAMIATVIAVAAVVVSIAAAVLGMLFKH